MARLRHWIARLSQSVLFVLAVVGFVGALAVGRGALKPPDRMLPASLVGLAAGATPTELKSIAAATIDTALAPGGTGVTFEIVQRATLHAKPGGPKIEIPDPNSRGSLGTTDELEVGTTVEHGLVTPAGFWMEMRAGPAKGEAPDFSGAEYQFGALVKAGVTYRNDGQGWYKTDRPPGIGLDPRTAALLPSLLRNATNPVDAGTDGDLRKLTAGGKVADAPGIMAVDAAPFTRLDTPLGLGFDRDGRLLKLHAVTQNTTVSQFDLLVDTVIVLAYPDKAPPLPDPTPTFNPSNAAKG